MNLSKFCFFNFLIYSFLGAKTRNSDILSETADPFQVIIVTNTPHGETVFYLFINIGKYAWVGHWETLKVITLLGIKESTALDKRPLRKILLNIHLQSARD